MPTNEGRSGLIGLFGRAGKMLGEFPILLIPSVIPAVWQFIAPRIGLINPAATLSASYVGFGIGAWRLLVYMLVFVVCLVISQGATVTLPEAESRYMTVMVVNEDHYINRVFSEPGSNDLTVDEFDSEFVAVFMRTFVDPGDPDPNEDTNQRVKAG